MTNSKAMSTTLASLNPASVSPMVMTPMSGSTAIMIRATASMRGRPSANITTAATSRASTTARSVFIGIHPRVWQRP